MVKLLVNARIRIKECVVINIAESSLNNNSIDIRINSDRAYICDISDIHVGNVYHNKKLFKKFIETVAEIPNIKVIIGGDSTENASTVSASSVFEERLHGGDQVLAIRDMLIPIRDKILFCRSGNHGYERSLKHNKLIPEQILAEFLGVPFFHGCASVFMNVRKNLYVVGTWHNAKKPEKMEWLQSDICFYEHLHNNNYQMNLVATPNRHAKRWSIVERYDVQSGSYLGWGGYSADKGYRPLPSMTPIVELSGIKDKRHIKVHQDISYLLDIIKHRGE